MRDDRARSTICSRPGDVKTSGLLFATTNPRMTIAIPPPAPSPCPPSFSFSFPVYQQRVDWGTDFLGCYHYLNICQFHFQHCVSLRVLFTASAHQPSKRITRTKYGGPPLSRQVRSSRSGVGVFPAHRIARPQPRNPPAAT
jgi:hypothetical protein